MTMSDSVYGQTTIPHCSNVIVLQEDHLVCVLDNGAVKTISGDTVEVFTHTEFSWLLFPFKTGNSDNEKIPFTLSLTDVPHSA